MIERLKTFAWWPGAVIGYYLFYRVVGLVDSAFWSLWREDNEVSLRWCVGMIISLALCAVPSYLLLCAVLARGGPKSLIRVPIVVGCTFIVLGLVYFATFNGQGGAGGPKDLYSLLRAMYRLAPAVFVHLGIVIGAATARARMVPRSG